MTVERSLTHNGETWSVSEWARKTGLKNKTIYMRLNAGWSVKDTLEKPIQRQLFAREQSRIAKRVSDKDRDKERLLVKQQSKMWPNWKEERDQEGDIL